MGLPTMANRNDILGWAGRMAGRLNREQRYLFLSFFLCCFGQGLFFYTWPVLMRELGAGPVHIGLIYAVANCVMTVSFLAGGWLTDRFERRSLMMVFWGVAAPAPLIFGMAHNWTQLFPGILLYYCYSGMPAFNAYLVSCTQPRNRASVFSLVYASGPIGMMLGSPLGGYAASVLGTGFMFILSFVANAAAVVALLPLKRQYPEKPGRSQVSDPTGPPESRFLSGKRIWSAAVIHWYLIFAGGYLTVLLSFPYLPAYAQDNYGLDIAHIGMLGSVIAVSEVIFMPVLGMLGDRWGKTPALAVALFIFSLSQGLIIASFGIPVLLLALALRGSSRAIQSLMTSMVADISPEGSVGRCYGLFGAVTGLAAVAAPYLGGWLYQANPHAVFRATGGTALALAVAVIFSRQVYARTAGARARDVIAAAAPSGEAGD